jgi:DNA-binding LytR/AlgR family response regulator
LRALPPSVVRPAVIFTTAYDQYAVEAFGLDAVDYLPKPFSFPRFLQAAQKARAAVLARQTAVAAPAAAAPNTADAAFLSIRTGGQYRRVLFDQILFFEGWNEYVRIHTEQGLVTVYDRLKNIEAQLPTDRFLRVHKSFIVAMARVESLENNELHLAAHRVPISRVHREQVIAMLFT